MRARTGKIARLPFAIREELNKRLKNGEPASRVLPWLNSLPEVQGVLEADFEGLVVNDQNLSDWRKGGYQDWLRQTDRHLMRLERTKELAQMSMQLAKANGGTLSEGAASILGGNILEVLEQLDDLRADVEEGDLTAPAGEDGKSRLHVIAEALGELTGAVARLRRGDHDKEILRQNDEKLAHARAELELAKQKFQRDTCAAFLKWFNDKRAAEIVTGGGDKAAQIDALGQLIFQEDWNPADGTV